MLDFSVIIKLQSYILQLSYFPSAMSVQKKNKSRHVNKAYVSRLSKYQSGEIPPTETIALTETGSIVFYENLFVVDKADKILKLCHDLDIKVPTFKNFQNRLVKQSRPSIWFGPVPYSYSNVTLHNHSFSETKYGWLEQLRKDMAKVFEVELNSCLVNQYRDGADKVEWHADNELIFGVNPTIVSLSFGVTRKFEICRSCKYPRHQDYSFDLAHGSVILMKGDMQKNWLHRVPSDRSCKGVRYNLTFRNVV